MRMIQFIVLTLMSTVAMSGVFAEEEGSGNAPEQKYFYVEQEIPADGKPVEKTKIVGPPSPPSGYEQRPVVPDPVKKDGDAAHSINNLVKEEE